tara:strand:- start:806 stop:1603 length:798 start_codon:yes stop_codon:yes gene_type:complete
MKKFLLFFTFIVMSCATFQVSTLNHDPIYGPNNTKIKVDVLTNDWDVFRKFRVDSNFRYDYALFASNQPYSWYFTNRYFNRWSMYNSYSTWDFYMNRNLFWSNWAFDYNLGSWNYPYWGRWNRSFAYNSNYRPYYDQFRIYNNKRRNRNVSHSATPRGSSIRYNQPRRTLVNNNSPVDVIVRDLREKGNDVRVINNSSELIRINQPRRNYNTPRSATSGPTLQMNRPRVNNSSSRVRSTPNVIRRVNVGRSSNKSSSRGNGKPNQ